MKKIHSFSLVFLIIFIAIAFVYINNNDIDTTYNQPTPIVTPLPSVIKPTENSIPNSVQGTVTGNLCYPSEGIPPGNIIAKNISTGETFVQKYNGTAVDPSGKFSFKLNSGTYHFKFEIGTGGSAGYYNQCAKTMTSADCTPDENHQHLDVVVESGQTISDISLCDFYYTSGQETLMKSTF